MIGGTIYLVGREYDTGELVPDPQPCSMCRRLIINAGISKVVMRNTADRYTIANVEDWIINDESVLDSNYQLS